LRSFDDWERQPLLLLDVDGVINDKACLRGAERPWRHRVLEVAGTRVCLPAYMPALIRYLALATDVWWCTSWRHLANRHLAPLLGIDPRPVLDANLPDPFANWKAAAARPVARRALALGREVYWIEDFCGMLPNPRVMPEGVVYIDTGADGPPVLRPEHLPEGLRPRRLRVGRRVSR